MLFLLYLATMMIPSQITLIPKFAMFNKMGLTGTHLTLILPGMITITGTFLMRQYFMQIPEEIIEAARLDDAGELKIIMKIMIPMARPAIFTIGLLSFISSWIHTSGRLL